MPIATAGIYEVKLTLDRAGEELNNVFHYRETAGNDGSAADLAADWLSTFQAPIQNVLSNAVTLVSVTATPIFGVGVDFTIPYAASTVGGLTGETMPIYVAASLNYQRDSREIGSGWKRFGPMTEAEVAGDFFSAAYMTVLQNLGTALEAQLGNPGGIFDPIIYRRANTAIDPAPRWVGINSIVAINRVTTQGSRKRF